MPAKTKTLADAVLEIVNRDVEQPLRRKIRVPAARMADARDRLAVRVHGEIRVAAHVDRRRRPPDDRRVEIPQLLGVVDRQVLPGNRSRLRRAAHQGKA